VITLYLLLSFSNTYSSSKYSFDFSGVLLSFNILLISSFVNDLSLDGIVGLSSLMLYLIVIAVSSRISSSSVDKCGLKSYISLFSLSLSSSFFSKNPDAFFLTIKNPSISYLLLSCSFNSLLKVLSSICKVIILLSAIFKVSSFLYLIFRGILCLKVNNSGL